MRRHFEEVGNRPFFIRVNWIEVDRLFRAWPNLNDAERDLIKKEVRDALAADCAVRQWDKLAWKNVLEFPGREKMDAGEDKG